ncbi:MAG: DNA replication and repair protein RecF [Gammaproteobacteria bacterium]|nr:DNA replication and repair protein RecF [Gammaproteobacteria bacterium]
MRIARISIRNIRCIASSSFDPSAGLNLLVGANGSGKTSLLEGIFFLGHGRSFRRVEFDKLVRRGEAVLSVFGEVVEGEWRSRIGIEKRRTSGRIRVDGMDAQSNKILAERLAVGAYYPGREALLWGPGKDRRQLMDWLLFHVEPDYGPLMRRFTEGLRQRNALLRSGRDRRTIQSWSEGLAAEGERIHRLRETAMDDFMPWIARKLSQALERPITLEYRRGWRATEGLASVWQAGLAADEARGWTGSGGPHRADIMLTTEGAACRDMLSRGEGKLASLELFLGAITFLRQRTGRRAVVLLDDLGSEIDSHNLQVLSATLRDLGHQIFISMVAPPGAGFGSGGFEDYRMFHVEQGGVSEVL